MKQETQKQIEKFLINLDTEIDVIGLVDIDKIDYSDAYNSIYEMISDNQGFDIDIIYYFDAINYLKENDPSLKESIEIALEYGYTLESVNSELLASLLASQNAREQFSELQNEIENFFNELEEDTIQKQFEECDKTKIFEIEVIDNKTNKNEYIIFNISIEENKFIATHEATTHAEERSNKIAFVEVEINPLFSLDEHLQELHEECIYKIINSDFFTLTN
jgi:hypothetical protein